ncbi:putative pentatricopeptide repeat domain-containing protein [Rosellinia necatrix]|uniref:Putative pentatricopeptide repeat domain-containing protein n=1 Tax=Rosellinia necatrix TaxID=77044 RepID=A0A1W2TK58_ROSNE|nr:putative pentatricopeptide repeat domain-containing protein [Rosellinia necatrix]
MQTLWSRAARTQSPCHRRICSHSVNTLVRRSTTGASRRKPTVTDVFTACYTTILGTATIIDARQKNERRQELDRELDRARASLKQTVAGHPQGHTDGDDPALGGGASPTRHRPADAGCGEGNELDRELVRELKFLFVDTKNFDDLGHRPLGTEMYFKRPLPTYIKGKRGYESVRPLASELMAMCNMAYRPLARRSWMEEQLDWMDIEVAIAAEEQDPETVTRDARSSHELAETTGAVIDLVDELVRRTDTHSSVRPQDDTQAPDPVGDEIFWELEDLRRGQGFPSYQFASTDPQYSTHIWTLLHDAIRRIFNQAATSREIVGRICYNLLTAGVPPTIHTYNILIAGFNRIQRPDLAQAVIDSYLDRTRWPATAQTVICLLNHYRGPGGREGMRDVVHRMRGVKEDGLHISILYEDQCNEALLLPKLRRSLEIAGRIAKTPRYDITFDRLIAGWLYHEEINIACMTFIAGLRAGAFISVRPLQELLRGCVFTSNFSGARKLLTGIIQHFKHFSWYLSEIIRDSTVEVAWELARNLDTLINVCWLPFGEIFGETYVKYQLEISILKTRISSLLIQLEVRQMEGFSSLLFDALSSDQPLLTRLGFATSVLDRAELSRQTRAAFDGAYTVITRIISIERRCKDLNNTTLMLVAALNAVIIEIKTGYDVDPNSILVSDDIASPALHDRRVSLHRALNKLDLCDNSLTAEDVVSLLYRQIPNPDLIRQLDDHGSPQGLTLPTVVTLLGHNAAPRVCLDDTSDQPHQQLEERVQATEDSIRALLFTHLDQCRQERAMGYYRGYYNIPFDSLVTLLALDLKYCLSNVLRTASRGSKREGVTSSSNSIPLATDDPVLGIERGLIEDREWAQEDSPHPQHLALEYCV